MHTTLATRSENPPVNPVRLAERRGISLTASVGLGALSGALALLASPPFGVTLLLYVALVPWLAASRRAGEREWAAAGLGFAMAYLPSIALGLLEFGFLAVAFFDIALAAAIVCVFAASGAVARRLPDGAAVFAFPACWTVSAWLLDEWLYAPVLLGAPVSLQHPAWAGSLALWGAPAFDGLLLCVSALVAAALTRQLSPLRWLAAAALLILAFLPVPPAPSARQTARVTIVQPAILWGDFRAAGWSPLARRSIEQKLDALTVDAAAGPDSLIVWPENGNGLPNAQLTRRRAALATQLNGRQLLLTGKEVESGQAHLAAFLVEGGAILGRARKANLVPLAESDLVRGDAGVLDTRQGRIGVAICFDALFGRHFRRLVHQGAEAFIVTTDDASLGHSSLAEWHAAYSLTRAMEAGRPLVFSSNTGPSRVYDGRTPGARVLLGAERSGTARGEFALRHDTTPALRGLRHLIPILALLLLIAAVPRRALSIERRSWRPVALAASTLLLVVTAGVALAAEAAGNAARLGITVAAVWEDAQRRVLGYGAIDALGPVFRQSEENTCGAAALAFALDLLGDNQFEHDLTRDYPRTHPEGYSLAELRHIASARGFQAEGLAGPIASLRDLKTDAAVVHMRKGHFVVVWNAMSDGTAHLFDPAVGAVLRVPLHKLEALWSGNYLRVRLAPVEIRPPVSGQSARTANGAKG